MVALFSLLIIEEGFSGISFLDSLRQEKVLMPGESYHGVIAVKNWTQKTSVLTIHQTDYLFLADGKIKYEKPGTLERSNASWVSINPKQVNVLPQTTEKIHYSINVPLDRSLVGTYWSMLRIEEAIGSSIGVEGDSSSFQETAPVKYTDIEIITNVGETGSGSLKLLQKDLLKDASKTVLQVNIENVGDRLLKPVLWAELYDQKGHYISRIEGERVRVYPGSSRTCPIDLSDVGVGSYKALVIGQYVSARNSRNLEEAEMLMEYVAPFTINDESASFDMVQAPQKSEAEKSTSDVNASYSQEELAVLARTRSTGTFQRSLAVAAMNAASPEKPKAKPVDEFAVMASTQQNHAVRELAPEDNGHERSSNQSVSAAEGETRTAEIETLASHVDDHTETEDLTIIARGQHNTTDETPTTAKAERPQESEILDVFLVQKQTPKTLIQDQPEVQYYKVQHNDWLSKIAQKFYGDPMKYTVIFEANKDIIKDPDLIYPGQKLQIPMNDHVASKTIGTLLRNFDKKKTKGKINRMDFAGAAFCGLERTISWQDYFFSLTSLISVPSPLKLNATSSMREDRIKIPRPLSFSRFSGASGSLILSGLNPLPSSLTVTMSFFS